MSAGRAAGRGALLVLRLATAGLFIWAAFLKLRDPREFLFSIKGFHIVPEHMLQPLAFMVPWTELVCALAFVFGFWARSAAMVLGAMLLVFIGAIVSVLARDMSVECGCFGDFALLCKPGAVGWCNVGQNVILLAIALPVMIWGPGALSWDGAARRRCRPPAASPMDSAPAAS